MKSLKDDFSLDYSRFWTSLGVVVQTATTLYTTIWPNMWSPSDVSCSGVEMCSSSLCNIIYYIHTLYVPVCHSSH